MPSRGDSKRARLAQLIAERSPSVVDEAEAERLRQDLAPISSSYLRRLLRESGVPLAPVIEGVSTSSLAELERTLLALGEVYRNGRPDVRALVIESKNHLRWAERRASEADKKAARAEMLLWALTWLENPEAFPLWVQLRKHRLAIPVPSESQ